MTIINYFSGAPCISPPGPANPAYMTGTILFDDEDMCDYSPLGCDIETSTTSATCFVSMQCNDSNDDVQVRYFQFDAGTIPIWPNAEFRSIVTEDERDDDGDYTGGGDSWIDPNYQRVPPPWSINRYQLSGATTDGSGTPIGGCLVEVFDYPDDNIVYSTTSDGGGNFSIPSYFAGPFYLRAYKAGSPDVAGTTRNDVMATVV